MSKRNISTEPQKGNVTRLEVKLRPREFEQLKELEGKLQMTRAELIRYSLNLFHWAANEVSTGKAFGVFDPETKTAKEVMLPGLLGLTGRE